MKEINDHKDYETTTGKKTYIPPCKFRIPFIFIEAIQTHSMSFHKRLERNLHQFKDGGEQTVV
jgi:hypothetical protein